MQLLWENSPQTITQITKALENQKGWSKNIVITYFIRKECIYQSGNDAGSTIFPLYTSA